ncbi:MAG TPA: dephospho-CoA kinase [Polyangiaceae bacterium]|nr:dephospho-CoA kinase [Polyangiaceae bacterium]
MRVFGLTGGLASGKSSVAAHWRSRGLPVIDADALAREVVRPGSPALDELVAEFGAEILRNGELDRAGLARLVFGHPEQLRRLEAITHPRIVALREQRLAELAAAGEPLVCSEIPLLYEKGLAEALRPIVVVSVPERLQMERARRRDGSSAAAVLARLGAQLPLAEKAQRAEYVIDNQGSLADLQASADQVLLAICRDLGVPAIRYGLTSTEP